MIAITLHSSADPQTIQKLLHREGLWVKLLQGKQQTLLFVEPISAAVDLNRIRLIPGVSDVSESLSAHPLIDKQSSQMILRGMTVGIDAPLCIIAGPCSVDSEAQIHSIAASVAKAGATFLRGGAFKPRTSPYSFQGHGQQALKWLREAADDQNLGVVTEVLDTIDIPQVADCADLIQIGTRNMHNYALLKSVGRTGKPILLKRGLAATIEEWLSAAEYCMMHGAQAVLFCERGIRSFDPSTRNLLDLGAVALLRYGMHLPVIVDPSHAVGRRDLIGPLSKAALAAGACGLMIETHYDPGEARSDGPQALLLDELAALIVDLKT